MEATVMVAPEPESVRRAALLLHGLPSASRAQVLQGLAPAEQARLKPLLAELVEIGVPGCLGQTLSHELRPASRVGQSAIAALDALAVGAVSARLEGCPAGLVADLLRARHWTWTQEVLMALPDWRRRPVMAALQVEADPLKMAVIEVIAARLLRLERAELPSAAVAPRSIIARIVAWFTWNR
jgi:hypothetical protein